MVLDRGSSHIQYNQFNGGHKEFGPPFILLSTGGEKRSHQIIPRNRIYDKGFRNPGKKAEESKGGGENSGFRA
jgi:hypothetical protein